MTLGEIIKEYRIKNDMSMGAFADRSGISKAYVAVLEKNQHPRTGQPIAPSIQCIRQAAAGMRMNFDDLFSMLDCEVSLIDVPEAVTDEEMDLIRKYRLLDLKSQGRVDQFVNDLLGKKEANGLESDVNAS